MKRMNRMKHIHPGRAGIRPPQEDSLHSVHSLHGRFAVVGDKNLLAPPLQRPSRGHEAAKDVAAPLVHVVDHLVGHAQAGVGEHAEELGVGEREDFRLFADWSRFHGNVLDVGVGPQKVPSHMRYAAGGDATFWGIDPLRGEQPREYGFVQGLGEFLPFGDGIFDQVLFVTSLDHFIDPRVPLREARRVLAAGGEVCVWLGEKD
jgi:hypothetical protein